MKKNNILYIIVISAFIIFVSLSLILNYSTGLKIGINFTSFSIEMLKVLPCAFILIGLFEVWVKKETVKKHLGEDSGFKGFIWAVILASTTVGGIYVALPVAYSLYNKGAKFSIIFTYIGASAICRIPMTIMEASFLGIEFTLIRFFVSLPLIIISSIIFGNYLTKKKFKINKKTI